MFGWDALVAIGTLVLAGATATLAWKTKNLADESSKEIAAGIRPVLAPSNADLLYHHSLSTS